MVKYADGRNLQKDKHLCNTLLIWALWRCGQTQSSLQLRHLKTLELKKKNTPKDPPDSEKQDYLVWWTSILSIMFEGNQPCLSSAEYHQVKCAGSSLMLWGYFSAAGILSAAKYRDSIDEIPVQSIRKLRLGRRFTFQRDNDPKHTSSIAYRQKSSSAPSNVKKARRRIADNRKMLMCNACRIIPKKIWGC